MSSTEALPSRELDAAVFDRVAELRRSIEGVIRGKPEAITRTLVALFAEGHLLIEDVPGVGKTMLAQALARSLSATFRRIQFTSDLLPSDIVGVSVFHPGRSQFEFKQGPIFANVVLADEINRGTPKTQSALLEAMNEAQVSVDNTSHILPRPFIVLATQNPIEHHGTYPLPESQLDRFLMSLRIGYPEQDQERQILQDQQLDHPIESVQPVLTGEDVAAIQRLVRRVSIDETLQDYMVRIARATRQCDELSLGVSPRGTLLLQRAAQSHALVSGRDYLLPDDVKTVAVPVLAHRVLSNRQRTHPSDHHWRSTETIIDGILTDVEVPL